MKKIFLFLALFMLMPFNVKAEGIVSDTNQHLWYSYINYYENTEFLNILADCEIVSNNNSFTISSKNTDGVEYSGIFNYDYDSGILTYDLSSVNALDLTNDQVVVDNSSRFLVDYMYAINAIYALSDLKGYDINQLDATFENKESISLEEDGVRIESINRDITDENGEKVFSGDIITAFQLDIKNGLKSLVDTNNGSDPDADLDGPTLEYTPEIDCDPEDNPEPTPSTPQEETVKNPETGLFNNYGVVIGSIVVLGAIGYFVIRKRSKFPQV